MEENVLTQLMRELTGECASLDLGGVMVGGCLGHSYPQMMVLVLGEGGGSAELLPWTSSRQTLVCLGAWLTESSGRQC